jgi:hypothetical protein
MRQHLDHQYRPLVTDPVQNTPERFAVSGGVYLGFVRQVCHLPLLPELGSRSKVFAMHKIVRSCAHR